MVYFMVLLSLIVLFGGAVGAGVVGVGLIRQQREQLLQLKESRREYLEVRRFVERLSNGDVGNPEMEAQVILYEINKKELE